jgi:hypothetical protein
MPPLVVRSWSGDGDWVSVRIWRDQLQLPHPDPEYSRWFSSFLGQSCRLVHLPDAVTRGVEPPYDSAPWRVSLADAYPLLVIGQGSLDLLNERLQTPVPGSTSGMEQRAHGFTTAHSGARHRAVANTSPLSKAASKSHVCSECAHGCSRSASHRSYGRRTRKLLRARLLSPDFSLLSSIFRFRHTGEGRKFWHTCLFKM